MVSFEILKDIDGLKAHISEWRALWLADIRATPFQSPEWLVPWAESFSNQASNGELFTVQAYDNGKLCALLPLYIYTRPIDGERQLLLLGAGTSDYLDGIFAPDIGPAFVPSLAEFISEFQDKWDVAHFAQLRSSSPLLALRDAEKAEATPCSELKIREHRIPSKLKRNLAYYQRRAALLGPLRVEETRYEDIPEVFNTLVKFHMQRWHSRGEPGALADARVLKHHRSALPLLYKHGLSRLYMLSAGKQLLAIAYVLLDRRFNNRRAYYYLSGFNHSFRDVSPGNLLLSQLLNALSGEGIEYLDLLRGTENYKTLWRARVIPTYGIEVPSASSIQATAA
jgi:CelD/BcsL family acetyltransferase involved in cellulose biosynthesis